VGELSSWGISFPTERLFFNPSEFMVFL